MVERHFLDSFGKLVIFKCFAVCHAVILQNLVHVLLCALREVAIKDSAENIVLELAAVHAAAQVICDSPELLCKLL